MQNQHRLLSVLHKLLFLLNVHYLLFESMIIAGLECIRIQIKINWKLLIWNIDLAGHYYTCNILKQRKITIMLLKIKKIMIVSIMQFAGGITIHITVAIKTTH